MAEPSVDALEREIAANDARLDAEWSAVTSRAELEAKRAAFRAAFRQRVGYDEIRKTPLNAKLIGSKDYGDYRIEKVLFESAPGGYVTGLVFLPDARRFPPPYAAFLFSPGHSDNGKAATNYLHTCTLGARNGLAVLSIDPLGQGERSQGAALRSADEHVRIGAYAALLGKTTMNYMMRDAVRAIDYLASRPDIDAAHLGAVGNSGGGTMTAFLAVVEPRLQACAPCCYMSSQREHVLACGPQDSEQNFFNAASWGFNHTAIMLASGRPFAICAAREDFFQVDGARATFGIVRSIGDRLGIPPDRYALYEADGPHTMSRCHRERAVEFMLRHLKGERKAVVERKLDNLAQSDITVTPEGEVSKLTGFRSIYDELLDELLPRCGKGLKAKANPFGVVEPRLKRKGKRSYYGRRKDAEELAVDAYILGRFDPSRLDPAPFIERLKRREYLSFAELVPEEEP